MAGLKIPDIAGYPLVERSHTAPSCAGRPSWAGAEGANPPAPARAARRELPGSPVHSSYLRRDLEGFGVIDLRIDLRHVGAGVT